MDGRQGAPYPYYNMDKIHTSSSDNEAHNFNKYRKKKLPKGKNSK